MFKANEYKMAVEWKKSIENALEQNEDPQEIADELMWLWMRSPSHNITVVAMGFAALACFTVAEDRSQYWTPATKDILRNYRNVKRRLSKGRPVYMSTVDTWAWDNKPGYERIA